MTSILIYLLQVSICQAAFYIVYYLVLNRQSFFQTSRAFIVFTTLLSFIIPALSFEVWYANSIDFSFENPILLISEDSIISEPLNPFVSSTGFNLHYYFINLLFSIYIIGFLIHLYKMLVGIARVFIIINSHEASYFRNHKVIKINHGPSFFSFWKFIFINEKELDLSIEQLQQVLYHEKVHISQMHTIDILFMELATTICWFNPFIRKMKDALCQVHEFIADSLVTKNHQNINSYSKLILKLSSSNDTIYFAHQFSMINIKNRIIMLNQSKTNKLKILKFLFVLPVVAILMMVFSCTDKPGNPLASNTIKGQDLVIDKITWEGNSKYTDALLTKFISAKTGELYNKDLIEQSLTYKPGGDDIGSLYMNNGFLYFNIEVKEEVVGDKINLTFVVYEGKTFAIDKINIKGNKNVPTNDVMEMLEFKNGELFDRSKLIQSQKNIAESGLFVSDSIMVKPIPHDEGKLVDIEYVVTEI